MIMHPDCFPGMQKRFNDFLESEIKIKAEILSNASKLVVFLIQKHGSLRKAASNLAVSPTWLSQVHNQKAFPSPLRYWMMLNDYNSPF